jgi:hypothetical protein
MNEFTIDANFKSAAARRNEFDRVNPRRLANFGRQTGSPRLIVSDRAVLDGDVCFHSELLRLNNICSDATCRGLSVFVIKNGARRRHLVDKFRRSVPGGIRTPNLLIRSQLLYPVELQTRGICEVRMPNFEPLAAFRN